MKKVKPKIVVVGSLNVDMTITSPRLPVPGESILGDKFFIVPGGKGNNQAITTSKLGADVEMIGCVGQDQFGQLLIDELKKNSIGINHVKQVENTSSGVALITVAESAENSIVVALGANNALLPTSIQEAESIIKDADVLLLQLEIPMETVLESLRMAKKHGVTTVLNPAPGKQLTKEVLQYVDYLTPNETEIKILLSYPVDYKLEEEELIQKLKLLDVPNVIITMGGDGVLLWKNGSLKRFPAFKVEAVDTTAAGDAFNGAFSVAVAEGSSTEEAIQFAQKVASIVVTKMGTSASIPFRDEVEI